MHKTAVDSGVTWREFVAAGAMLAAAPALAHAAAARTAIGLYFMYHYGLGHDTGAHAADEYYRIDSSNPKVQGLDGAVASFVEYLHALA
jgi:hypothetical protein